MNDSVSKLLFPYTVRIKASFLESRFVSLGEIRLMVQPQFLRPANAVDHDRCHLRSSAKIKCDRLYK